MAEPIVKVSAVGGPGSDTTAIHDDTAAEISAITEKASPINADLVIIEDSADSNSKKKVQVGNLPAGAGDLKADGTVPLTANWDVGAYTITGTQFISDIATGTAPFVVASTTVVANLQAATVASITGLEATTVATIAGLAPDTATTQAAQSAITSVGTLTGLTMGGDIDFDGNNIDNLGVAFLKEQAAADGDVDGSGQVWIKDDDPNTLWFTNDVGTDLLIAGAGKQTIFVPVEAMTPSTTSSCSALTLVEAGTNDIDYNVMDFDKDADEMVNFRIQFPKSWNKGTVTFSAVWMANNAASTGVAIGLQAVALADNDAVDTAFGDPIVITDDNQGAANDILITAESAPVTIAGSPSIDEIVVFRVFRDISDGNDDLAVDMRLLGIRLFFTTNAANDA